MRNFIATLLFAVSAHATDFHVVTYNMGQLRVQGLDIIPCTDARLGPQMAAIEQMGVKGDTVFLLQEAWTAKVFSALKNLAKRQGWAMVPARDEEVAKNGLIILSTLPLKDHELHTFRAADRDRKGVRFATITLTDGRDVRVADTHTAYSDSRGFRALHRSHFNEIGELVAARDQGLPLVFGGDFNAGHNIVFRRQRYPASERIWDQGLVPLMDAASLQQVSQQHANTWDMEKNKLVSNPSFWVDLSSLWSLQTWGWEEKSAVLDHVFASPEIEGHEGGLAFNTRWKMNCPLRDGGLRNLGHLSDHYGSWVRLSLP